MSKRRIVRFYVPGWVWRRLRSAICLLCCGIIDQRRAALRQNLVVHGELRSKLPLYFQPMHRFILILLLAILPLQFSWAAVANVCQHEADRTAQHLGHHGHEHAGADTDKVADPSSDDGVLKTKTSFDTDCHGHGVTALMGSTLVSPLLWSGGSGLSVYRCQIPGGSPDRLLRPPSSHLA